MWHFGVVRMSHIDRIVLSLTYITCIRFVHLKLSTTFSLSFQFFLFLFPFSNKIIEPRIRACCVIRRVREVDNIFILSNRESFYLTKFRQFLAKLFTKIDTAGIVAFKFHAKANYLFRSQLYFFKLLVTKQIYIRVAHSFVLYLIIIRMSS